MSNDYLFIIILIILIIIFIAILLFRKRIEVDVKFPWIKFSLKGENETVNGGKNNKDGIKRSISLGKTELTIKGKGVIEDTLSIGDTKIKKE